jgi:chitin synthase
LSLTQASRLTVRRTQFAAIYLAVRGVQQVSEAEHRGAQFSDLFSNAIFRDIVLSIAATNGLYIVASIIHVRGFGFEDHS